MQESVCVSHVLHVLGALRCAYCTEKTKTATAYAAALRLERASSVLLSSFKRCELQGTLTAQLLHNCCLTAQQQQTATRTAHNITLWQLLAFTKNSSESSSQKIH
jgi:hypothetical protein